MLTTNTGFSPTSAENLGNFHRQAEVGEKQKQGILASETAHIKRRAKYPPGG